MSSFSLLAAYVAGVLIGDNSSPFSSSSLLLPGALLVLWLIFRQQQQIAIALMYAITLCLGVGLYDLNRYPRLTDAHLVNFTDRERVIIDGRILTTTARAPTGYSIDIQSARILDDEQEIAVHGRLRLFVENGANLWNPGDDIRFNAKLRRPRLFGTPGEFDLGRQLAISEIFVTAFLPASDEILLLRPAAAEDRSLIERGRTATGRFIAAQTSPAYGPLVKALAIGDKSGLSPEFQELLGRSGLSHLFAISGLHLSLVALALYALGLTIYRRSTRLLLATPPARCLPILIAPLLLLYLLWTGNGISTQRALLMVLAGTLLFLIRRKTDPMNILWLSALIILLYQPLALFTPSFQLSFAALAGILCGYRIWAPLIQERSKAVRYLATLFCSSLAATLATLPLVLHHFNLLAPCGIISNLFAIPVISWVGVPLALAGSLLWPVAPQFAIILLNGCEAVISLLLNAAVYLTSLPVLSGWTLYPSLTMTAIITVMIIALFLRSAAPFLRQALIGTALLLMLWGMRKPAELTITAISVGQGESTLISIGSSHYLIDGGGLYSDRIDTGRQLVAPALGRLGVHHLTGVILTHAHPDHAKGLPAILSDIPCDQLIVGAPLAADDPLHELTIARQIPVEVAAPGWAQLFADNAVQLFIFRPSGPELLDENDLSLVTYVRRGTQGALLTGDLAANGIKKLINTPPPGPVTLLKLPHHGSRHSNPASLISYLQPRTAFVSAGYQNRFGFPHDSVVTFLERSNIPLYRTDQNGSHRFLAHEDDWQVKRLKSGFFIDTGIATLLQNVGLYTLARSRP